MQFRARTPQGKTAIIKLDDGSTTVQDLRDAISKNLDIKHEYTISFGFPPKSIKLIDYPKDQKIGESEGLKLNGESVQVIPVPNSSHTATEPQAQNVAKAGPSSTSVESLSTDTSTTASRPEAQPSSKSKSQPQPSSQTPTPSSRDQDVPLIPIPAHSSAVTIRVMPDDNSCLFRAIAAATSPATSSFTSESDDYVSMLRYQVASYVTSNGSSYPAPMLDNRTPDRYAAWIQQESSWGGDVELDVLSRVLGVEIWCCQVKPFFVRKYNESSNGSASEFIVLVYSGIHYDTVALSPSASTHPGDILPAEFDIRKYDARDKEWMLDGVRRLCDELANRGYMTDTSSFGVMCKVPGCGWVGQGEKEAVKHAKDTGHGDLEEIR